MMRTIRLAIGCFLTLAGIALTIFPGSTLLVLAGLMILSYDWPRARHYLKVFQSGMSSSARRLDRYLLARKLR